MLKVEGNPWILRYKYFSQSHQINNTIFVAPLDPNFKEESEVWLSEVLNLQYFTIWNYSVLNIHRGIIQILQILTLQNLDFNDQQKLYLLVNKDPYRELQNWNK